MSPSRNILLLLFLVGCLQGQTNAVITVSGVLDIIKVGKDIIVALYKTWNLVEDSVNVEVEDGEVPIPFFHNTEHKLLEKIDRVNLKLEDLSARIDNIGSQSIATIQNQLPERVRLELRLNDLLDYLTRIDIYHRSMKKYVTHHNDYEKLTLEDFARSVISHDPSSVVSLVERIHSFIVPTGRGISHTGLIGLVAKGMEEVEGDMICNTKQSAQQVLYNLYDAIALTELKGYTMIQFSYMLLKVYGKGNFTKESQEIRARFEERTNNAVVMVRNAMLNVSRQLWNCDPKKHIKGETYQEITNFLQGYIQNEADLNAERTCLENCGAYTNTKSYGCYDDLFCKQHRSCNGKLVNCRFFDSYMRICKASLLSGRRYEYIEYENKKVLGRKEGCANGTTKAESWWRWLFWHCSYCFCICDEQGPMSDRYFNMRPVVADILNNRIVTGLRFVKKNRIIHLEIQEGELLPRAIVNTSTISWKPAEDYKITDKNIFNGHDYHTFTWEQRKIDLDDLEADEGYVLTGVQFKPIGTHLNFEIYTTKFDFDTGKLKPEYSKWKNNPNTDASISNPRSKLKLKNPDIPIRSISPSIPTSSSDQYIELTHSDIEKDAAQTTVPFLDTQKVESLLAVPLSGAGIFHKGREYYGGFITPKITTYDISQHLKPAFSSVGSN